MVVFRFILLLYYCYCYYLFFFLWWWLGVGECSKVVVLRFDGILQLLPNIFTRCNYQFSENQNFLHRVIKKKICKPYLGSEPFFGC